MLFHLTPAMYAFRSLFCTALRDLIDLAQIEAAKDYNIFRTAEGKTDYFTPLDFGKIIVSKEMLDGAGRLVRYKWCVVDEKKMFANI